MALKLTLRQRHYLERLMTYGLVIFTISIIAIPIVWTLISTLRPSRELFTWPPTLVPTEITLNNYIQLLNSIDFFIFFRNSLLVAIMAMILTLVVAIPAAYSIARYEFYGAKYIANLSTLIYMFPLILLGIPMFIIFSNANLTNSLFGLALAHTAFALPFALLLLGVFFKDISPEIEESARITGASRYTIVRRIILPLSLPGIVATVIFTMAVSWNEFFFALILLNNHHLYTLPRGIASLVNISTTDWGMVLAGVMIMIVPPLVLIFFLYKYLIKGFGVSTV